jgi:uncharacterized surface protein with fasciclin (FAS1) repeats
MRNVPCGLALAALVAAVPLTAARAEDAYAAMSHDSRFRTWTRMVNSAGLQGYARGKRPYTIFAPVEESMANIDPDLMAAIGPKTSGRDADVSQTVFVVRSHVVADKVPLNNFAGKVTTLKSVNGKDIVVDATKSPVELTFVGSNGTLAGDPIITDNATIYPVLIKSAHYVPE